MPKLAHTKSTRGCLRCKQRKVKCNEARPVCGACDRHKVPCEYNDNGIRVFSKPSRPASTTSRPSPSHNGDTPQITVHQTPGADTGSNPGRILELRLMLHYATVTSLSVSVQGSNFWNTLTPKLGLQHGFLLDAILGLAALHLTRIDTADTEAAAASWTYYDRALEGQTQVIRAGIESTSLAEALFLNSAIISIYALALSGTGPIAGRDASRELNLFSWLRIASGLRVVFRATREYLMSSTVLSALFSQKPDLLSDEAFSPTHRKRFQHLLDWGADFETITEAEQIAYNKAVSFIGLIYTMALDGDEEPMATCRRILAFPGLNDERFIELVEQHRPRALVIMAHLFAAFKVIKHDMWWYKGVPERHVGHIAQLVPEGWKTMMQYPVQLCEGQTQGLTPALSWTTVSNSPAT